MATMIVAEKFSGMNDVKTGEGYFADENTKTAEPTAILNADVDVKGRIVKRSGKTLLKAMAGTHSLWGGVSCMIVAAANKLYRVRNGTVEEIGAIGGPNYPLSYAEVDDLVYVSNRHWCRVFDPRIIPTSSGLLDWGIDRPSGPMLTTTTGGLVPGIYHVCMTNESGGEISGNGPISQITLSSSGGISILNRPSGAIAWCTDVNSGIFYRIGPVSNIVSISSTEPLPSFLCHPPIPMDNLCYAFGIMWGSVGNIVYHSQPYHPQWFRSNLNRFTFDSEVTLIARTSTGLFIGTEERTLFLAGTEPANMEQHYAGAGSVRGTLTYCNNIPELNDILGTVEKGYVDVPCWRTAEGIVLGNTNGKLFNITKGKLALDIPARGASLYRNVGGNFQIITSSGIGSTGSSVGSINETTLALFKAGKVSGSEFTNKGMGTTGSISETVTCTVTRGGVEI